MAITFQTLKSEVSDGNISDYKRCEQSKKGDGPVEWYKVDENTQFTVSLFGRTDDGRDVCCHVTGFYPYHHIRVENHDDEDYIRKTLLEKLHSKFCRAYCKRGTMCKAGEDVWLNDMHEPIDIKSNYGFRNGETDRLIRVSCKSLSAYHKAKKCLTDLVEEDGDQCGFTIVDKVEPIVRFFGVNQINPCGWYTLDLDADVSDMSTGHSVSDAQTTCAIEFVIDCATLVIHAIERKDLNAMFIQMTIDIETYTKDRKKGGIDPTLLENPCFCVGLSVYEQSRFTKKYIYYVGDCAEWFDPVAIDNVQTSVFAFSEEKQMLEALGERIKVIGPDVLNGYNSDNFDFYYLFERGMLLGCNDSFFHFSKVIDHRCNYTIDTVHKRPDVAGVFVLDAYIVINADVTKRYESYRLDYVAKQIIKEAKIDLDYEQMYALYEGNTREGATEIAKYCMQDVLITQKVITVDVILRKLMAMSNLLKVDISWLITKGQTARCTSMINVYYAMKKYNYYFDNIYIKTETLGGGHVEEPKRGKYDDPTVVLDFKSLYPSIMQARQMDFSSVVLDDRYMNLPGVDYYTSTTQNPLTGETMAATFARKTCPEEENDCLHVIPELLKHLSAERQSIKRQMKKLSEDSAEYASLDSEQNAIKVTMNSFYGFIGGHKYPLAPLAQSITGDGRNMLALSKTVTESSLPTSVLRLIPRPPVVVYGDTDSIFVQCPGASEEQSIAFGKAAADYLTQTVFNCAPIEMEYEKTLLSLILINRKNYVYTVRDKDTGEPTIIYYGGEKVKRDYCNYFHDVYEKVCGHLFFGTKDALTDARNLEYSLEALSVSSKDELTQERSYYSFIRQLDTDNQNVVRILQEISNKRSGSQEDVVKRGANTTVGEQLSAVIRHKLEFFEPTQRASDSQRVAYAKAIFETYIIEMLQKRIDLAQLAETRKLAPSYVSNTLVNADGEKQRVHPYDPRDDVIPNNPAVKLARRIKKRSPGEEPSIGMRFSFLKILEFDREDKKSDQVELLSLIKQNDIAIDYIAYLTKDGKPFQKLFAVLESTFECGNMIDAYVHQETVRINSLVKKKNQQAAQDAKAILFGLKQKKTADDGAKLKFSERKITKSASTKNKQKLEKEKTVTLDRFFAKKL